MTARAQGVWQAYAGTMGREHGERLPLSSVVAEGIQSYAIG